MFECLVVWTTILVSNSFIYSYDGNYTHARGSLETPAAPRKPRRSILLIWPEVSAQNQLVHLNAIDVLFVSLLLILLSTYVCFLADQLMLWLDETSITTSNVLQMC